MTRRAGRVRRLLAARHLTVRCRRADASRVAIARCRTVARCARRDDPRRCRTAAGRRRSGSTTSSGPSGWASRGSTATTCTGSRAARPRPAGACCVRPAADGTTADVTPPPFNVRTRVHEYGGGSYIVAGGMVVFSNFADGRLYRLDPGADAPRADHARGPVALRRPAVRPGAAPLPRRPRGPQRPTASRRHADRRRSPLDGERAPRVLVEGPDFLAAPRLVARRRPAGLARVGPPGHALGRHAGCASPPVDRGRHARRERPGRRRPGRVDRPARMGARRRRSTSSATGAAGGTCTASSTGRASSRSPPMEAEFADPAWIFDRSSYGFLPDGVDRGGRPGARARPALPHRARASWSARSSRRSPSSTRSRGRAARGRRRLPARRPSRRSSSRFDPATLAPAGVLRRSSAGRVDPARHLDPGGDHVPDHRRARRPTRSTTRRRNPDSAAPDGRAAAARRAVPRRPDVERVDRARPGQAVPDQPRDRRRRRRLRRQHRLRAGVPPARSTGEWGVVDVDDCVAAARFLVERGDVDPERLAIEGGSAGGYTTLAALAFRDVVRGRASACSGSATSRRWRGTPTSSSRATLDRLVGPYPEAGRPLPRAIAGPLPRPRSRARCSSCRASTTRSCRRPRPRRSSRPSAANGIPHAYLAVRGRGPRVPGRRRRIRRTLEARLAFLGEVFGFSPADDLEPLEMPGLEAWQASPRACAVHRRPTARPHRTPADRADLLPRARPDRAGPRPARRRRRPGVPRPPASASPYPILLVLGGLALGFLPGLPGDRARAGRRVPAVPAADPVRRRRTSRRSATSRRTRGPIAAPGDRARAVHDGRRRRRRPAPWSPSSGSPPPSRSGAIVAPPDAVAATSIFRRLGRPAPDRDDPRGREPDQRRLGADRLPVRGAVARAGQPFSLLDAGARVRRRRLGGRRWSGSSSASIVTESWRRTVGPDARDHGLAARARSPPTCRPRRSGVSGVLATVVAGLIAGRRAARVLSPDRPADGPRRLGDRRSS